MEKPNLETVAVRDAEAWAGQEKGALDRFSGRAQKLLAAALMAVTVEGCTVYQVGGSRTQIGGEVNREGHNNIQTGDIAELCQVLSQELRRPGAQRVSGTHQFRDGRYTIEGFKLPDGRVVTMQVVAPNGRVYGCQ